MTYRRNTLVRKTLRGNLSQTQESLDSSIMSDICAGKPDKAIRMMKKEHGDILLLFLLLFTLRRRYCSIPETSASFARVNSKRKNTLQ